VTLDFNAATFAIGQEETPHSPARASFQNGRMITDWTGNRRVLTQELRPVTGGVQRQRRVTAGGIGMLETDGRPAPDAAGTVAANERALRLSPERLLLSALDRPGALTPAKAKTVRNAPADAVGYASGPDTLELVFDRVSGLLLAVEQLTDDPILGDRRAMTIYTRWQDAGGIKLPRQVDVEWNGRLQGHAVYTAATVGGAADASVFSIPDSIAARAPKSSTAVAPMAVALAPVAPGVWHATGGSHHSLIVEQPTGLIVVEGPFSAARTVAVLDTLKRRFPSKPVQMVIATHHHWDHTSGLRAYLAAGVPVLIHNRSTGFVEQIASAPKTVAPDELSRAGGARAVRGVGDSLTVGTGAGRVVLYGLPTVHVEGMLMAYVPSGKVLFNSDLFGPPQQMARASALELRAAVRARNITVDWVAGGHGGPAVAWAEVEKAAQ